MSLPVVERSSITGEIQPLPKLSRSSASYSGPWAFILVVADLTIFCSALLAAGLIGYHGRHLGYPFSRLLLYNAFYVLLWLFVFERLGLYRRTAALTVKDELYFTVAALTIGIIPQFLLFTIVPAISTSRTILLYALAFSIVGEGFMRTGLHAIRKKYAFRQVRRIAIIGSVSRIEQVRSSLDLSPRSKALLIAVEDLDERYPITVDGELDLRNVPWLHRALSWECDTIVFADIPPPGLIPHLLETAALHQVRIAFAPPRIRLQSYALSLEIDGHQALIVPGRLKACTPRARLVKRLMDVVVASFAALIFAPLMVVCALAIWIESGRPIFYRQQRVGLNGRVFDIMKFRSMRVDAEDETGAIWAKKADDRCTRVGRTLRRFSFDELPQLFNVLKGDMSLVGPRPERPVFVEAFRAAYSRYDERHLVRPGISGLSQMQMRRILDTNEVGQKLTFDLYYLEEWSLFMDLSLLIRTAAEFLFQRAA
jgi:exopolysaccharide biosynthesis polyprenyl glycosylphosphotransferase